MDKSIWKKFWKRFNLQFFWWWTPSFSEQHAQRQAIVVVTVVSEHASVSIATFLTPDMQATEKTEHLIIAYRSWTSTSFFKRRRLSFETSSFNDPILDVSIVATSFPITANIQNPESKFPLSWQIITLACLLLLVLFLMLSYSVCGIWREWKRQCASQAENKSRAFRFWKTSLSKRHGRTVASIFLQMQNCINKSGAFFRCKKALTLFVGIYLLYN